jgi:hypothetical protein
VAVFSDDFGALWYFNRWVVKVKRKLFKALSYYFKLSLHKVHPVCPKDDALPKL